MGVSESGERMYERECIRERVYTRESVYERECVRECSVYERIDTLLEYTLSRVVYTKEYMRE